MDVTGKFVFTELTAMIADYRYYADHESEIDRWLEERECERTGMVIKFNNEQTKMMFMMRWV